MAWDWIESLLGKSSADEPLVALDLETTGLDPKRDAILSAGWVPVRDGSIRWGEWRYRLVDAATSRGAEAVPVHGLLPDETASAEPVSSLVDELAGVLSEHGLLVHWGRLDVGILRRVFREHDVPWPKPRVVDTVDLLRRLDRRRSLTVPHAQSMPTRLSAAREAVDLPPHHEHHALYDALATAELYLCLRSRLA